VDGAAMAFIARGGLGHEPVLKRARALMLQRFEAASLEPADIERWQREGERLNEEALAAVCLGSGGA
jgi:hypothetical protein